MVRWYERVTMKSCLFAVQPQACAAVVWPLGACGEVRRQGGHACGARLMDAVFCGRGRGGRGAVWLWGAVCAVRSFGLSACVTERYVRAFGAVGGTRLGRSRVKKQNVRYMAEIGGGWVGGRLGEVRDSAQILPRCCQDLVDLHLALKSSDI